MPHAECSRKGDLEIQKKDTPVLLLTGYLGSGKTTLVNHILSNDRGIKFAVIVNDIGEVNIDADLIQKGGIVGQKDESLVALQNGCICCTLKMDLVEQLTDIIQLDKFDYIVIEASGICEPEPIARTICSIPQMPPHYTKNGIPKLDAIVTVVDALRMQNEFACGEQLKRRDIDEDDIENLIIQQLEFCNIVVINKASEVSKEELGRIKKIVENLRPGATIMECDWAEVPLPAIINTKMFDYNAVSASAGWVRELERAATEEEEHEALAEHHEHNYKHNKEDEHEHHHEHEAHEEHEHGLHHHHHHEEGEAEEYGIGTFVYYRRKPFDINRFDSFVAKRWPVEIIRAKGICYFNDNPDMSYLFEQAGVQKTLQEAGQWYATAPEEELLQMAAQDPSIVKDWDDKFGDRMVKIVFIGQHLDKDKITELLDFCIDNEFSL